MQEKKGGAKEYDVVDRMPKGWKVSQGALTAPRGYTWVNNNKSLFGGQRRNALIKTSNLGLSNG